MRRDKLAVGAFYSGRSDFIRKITALDFQQNQIKWCDRVGPGECKVATFLNWASDRTLPDAAERDAIQAAITRKRDFERDLIEEGNEIMRLWKAGKL